MAGEWLQPQDVAGAGGIRDVSGNDALSSATAAARSFVEGKRSDLYVGVVFTPTAAVKHGAAMLGSRLYERRGAILGVPSTAGFPDAGLLVASDPDIEQLLGIGRARPFGFGAPIDPVEDEEVEA